MCVLFIILSKGEGENVCVCVLFENPGKEKKTDMRVHRRNQIFFGSYTLRTNRITSINCKFIVYAVRVKKSENDEIGSIFETTS